MITEFRRLVFSNDELKIAVEVFHREKTPLFPSGDIMSVVPVDGPAPMANIRLELPGSKSFKDLELDGPLLAAIMLHYLIRIKTPIPRNAHKQIERFGDRLGLSLSINALPTDFDAP